MLLAFVLCLSGCILTVHDKITLSWVYSVSQPSSEVVRFYVRCIDIVKKHEAMRLRQRTKAKDARNKGSKKMPSYVASTLKGAVALGYHEGEQ